MENYIRRVRITKLFGQERELVVNFNQSINCIYGVNGTGKTVFLNLIVNALRINDEELLNTPFSSITILTSPDAKNQPKNFLTVQKDRGQIRYSFYDDHSMPAENTRYKIIKNLEYRPLKDQMVAKVYIPTEIESNLTEGILKQHNLFDNDIENIPKDLMQVLIMRHISLTYVPLLRYSETGIRRETQHKYNWRDLSDIRFNDISDPNIRVLKELQEEFSRRYATAQSEIARRLESLSSMIFEKLLIDEATEDSTREETKLIQELLSTQKVDIDDTKVESVIAQISDLNLNIPKEKIRKNYSSWIELQKKLLAAKKELDSVEGDVTADENRSIYDRWSSAYFNLIASARVYKRLEEAIDEIQKVHFLKQLLLGPFDKFKKEINQFLLKPKKFTFDDSGEFQFFVNNKSLDASNLSSGEKHLFAILGRVCFSSDSSISTFIADEPELSLHLEWQRKILPAIRRLSPNTQVIVATHAPAIMGLDSNTIDIEGCYKNV